jgi:hypothetical protein
VLAAMYDTVSDGVDSCAAKLAKPIYRADRGDLMVSDRLRLLKLVATFITHPDAGVRSDFLESTACEPTGI